ncbi:hypothetical protein BGK67_30080 [Streptomyces subrutilus]|uniref:Lipoprotein n=2 Tax=Streptomyces subrutilus TaxID=36818 RepID=A0A1E5PZM9_9ACTN|nr:hypothetical protein BGK67_30080 [Streptomyces subrutilus]
MAALTAATATACAPLLRDLGPLPPRFTGPPLSADAVVSEMTSVLAAEGITVEREPSDMLGRCTERLSGRHEPQTVDAALRAALARARSEHGWQDGPDLGGETLTLTKSNWTVLVGFLGEPAEGVQAPVVMSLRCLDGGETSSAPAAPTGPAFTPGPASS